MKTPALDNVYASLQQYTPFDNVPFNVPGAWVGSSVRTTFASGTAYLLHQIDQIRASKPTKPPSDLLYNALVRHVTSFAHYQDDASKGSWRTTGTFLKLLALAPYLHSIGVTQLMLLPVFSAGSHGRKGALGSPYAVCDPYQIHDELADFLPGVSALQEAQAMVETMHAYGIKVVVEVVLRTASIDARAVSMHPEWFYWVDETDLVERVFHPPAFTSHELATITEMVKCNQRYRLPEPSQEYRSIFRNAPAHVMRDAVGWLGIGAGGERLRIPSAFADWPPDDLQPLWSDVTYYKLHRHPDLNYMAYNTIRMFDERLDHEEYPQRELWNELANIIPYYQHMLGIDGAMIDMGHALPRELRYQILERARAQNSHFLIYEESFDLDEAIAVQGVDAVIGYLPHASRSIESLREFTSRCAEQELPVHYFGAADSHNTPRIASTYHQPLAAAVWRYISYLPKAIPYVVAGFELGEVYPINTGLGFTDNEQQVYMAQGLPLFDDVPLSWDRYSEIMSMLHERATTPSYRHILGLLRDNDHVVVLEDVSPGCLAYLRQPRNSRLAILVILNMAASNGWIRLRRSIICDLSVGNDVSYTDDAIVVSLQGEQCRMYAVLLRSAGSDLRARLAP